MGFRNGDLKILRGLAKMYVQDRGTFLAFAKEGKKNKVLVTRTYQETITNAIEACFSFRGLNLRDYLAEMTLTEDMSSFRC